MKSIKPIFSIVIIITLLFALIPTTKVHAYTYLRVNQTTTIDDGSCTPTHCTIREAIHYATSGDTIDFAPLLSGQTIVLDDGPLFIDKNLTINGSALSDHVVISGDNQMMVFVIGTGFDATFISLDITEAKYGLFGGGVFINGEGNSIIVNDVNFYDNEAQSGAAIGIKGDGRVTVINSNFKNNASTNGCGGAIFIDDNGTFDITNSEFVSNESEHEGGAICLKNGSANIENSTFTGNFAVSQGGAIYLFPDTSMTITNTTIFSNAVDVYPICYGGGIFADDNSELIISNSTISNNKAQLGGGLYLDMDANVSITNTILANSSSGYDCYRYYANVLTNTANLVETNAPQPYKCAFPVISADPALGRLQDNGGPTRTMAIGSDSPALDAGDNSVCESTDQRGYSRPVDGDGDHSSVCDIGAYELQ
ncbi:MAG: right-handed parallel beta-helix repeat-containing protein [Anaerolineaceae bacterium]|nr:right-handed parallel beta-helix repeat-containing protein [Anaerolineaceae bacterium]